MAFSPEEQAVIEWGQKNGKSVAQIKEAVFNLRTGQKPVAPPPPPQTTTSNFLELANSFNEGASSSLGIMKDVATGGLEKAAQGFALAQEKPTSPSEFITKPVESGLKVGAGFLQTLGAPFAPIFAPVGKAVQKLTDTISGSKAVQDFANTEAGQTTARVAEDVQDLSTIAGFGAGLTLFQRPVPSVVDRHITSAKQIQGTLPPGDFDKLGGVSALNGRLKTNIVDSLKAQGMSTKVLDALDPTNFASVDDFANAIRNSYPRPIEALFPTLKGANPKITNALNASEDILATSRAKNTPATVVQASPFTVQSVVKDIRFALSEIDPQVQTILQRSTFDEVNKYFQYARNAKLDPAKPNPLALAGQKLEESYKVISDSLREAIRGKKEIIVQYGSERLPGNTLNDVVSDGIQRMNNRFGADINAKGEVRGAKGRQLQLDDKDAALIGEYFARLNKLGVAPTLRELDDFVDWSQTQLYKQSGTLNRYEVASEPVISELRYITGALNKRLKENVGNGYGEVNARVSDLIEQQDEISRVLGVEGDKGASLMKQLFSPAGEKARRIFQAVYDETGIDLFKEATLAKFAMESVGDVRQASLLKQLDIGIKEAGTLDITKPLSIINFIRERADLDAQELANEIIRRSNASASR